MELTLVGLQYSGKTTFVNVIAVSRRMNCVVCVCVTVIPTQSLSVSESVSSVSACCCIPQCVRQVIAGDWWLHVVD